MPEYFNDLHTGRKQPQTTLFVNPWLSLLVMTSEITVALLVPPKRLAETPSDKITR